MQLSRMIGGNEEENESRLNQRCGGISGSADSEELGKRGAVRRSAIRRAVLIFGVAIAPN